MNEHEERIEHFAGRGKCGKRQLAVARFGGIVSDLHLTADFPVPPHICAIFDGGLQIVTTPRSIGKFDIEMQSRISAGIAPKPPIAFCNHGTGRNGRSPRPHDHGDDRPYQAINYCRCERGPKNFVEWWQVKQPTQLQPLAFVGARGSALAPAMFTS